MKRSHAASGLFVPALVAFVTAAGAAPPPCLGGRFVNRKAIRGDAFDPRNRFIEITTCPTTGETMVTIPSCGTVPAKVKVARHRTRLTTGLVRCPNSAERVKLRGHMTPDCRKFKGHLVQPTADTPLRVVKGPRSRCGDHVADFVGKEQCDGEVGCDPTCHGNFVGGSGAFGIVTAEGLQKLYIPLTPDSGNSIVAVIDVGVHGEGNSLPALIKNIDLGTSDEHATATAGDTDVVVATSTDSPNVWLIAPKTDTLVNAVTLEDRFGRSAYSGGMGVNGVVTGVVVDSAMHRAILSVGNGFAFINVATGAVVGSIALEGPAGPEPSENFGFDASRNRLIAPFYLYANPNFHDDRTIVAVGVHIIELANDTVYQLQDGDQTGQVSFDQPDAAAADPSLDVIVIAPERSALRVLDLDPTRAVFDASTHTVRAPQKSVELPEGIRNLAGVAIDRTLHYAFFEEEFGTHVGVLKLDDFLDGKASLVVAKMPAPPGKTAWKNVGDPHGVAVTTGVEDGASLGFLLYDSTDENTHRNTGTTWVARIDLVKFAAGASNLPEAVTFLDASTPREVQPEVGPCAAATVQEAGPGPGSRP